MYEIKLPLVSIVVPCYNQAIFLPETLDSILAQTYQRWECIIVNDGSTDETKTVASKYCSIDKRFVYIEQANAGLSSARNSGIRSSSGIYILPLDSDDKIAPEYIELAVNCFEKNSKLKIVYCRAAFFGKRIGEWKLPMYSLDRMLGRNCIFCSALYKRMDFNRVGGYNINMKYGHEDWDFWLSVLEVGGEVHQIDKILFYYRIRKRSMARSLDMDKIKFLRRKVWENHRKLYADYFLDVTETNEYCLIAHSMEYKIGSILLKPFRLLYNWMYK